MDHSVKQDLIALRRNSSTFQAVLATLIAIVTFGSLNWLWMRSFPAHPAVIEQAAVLPAQVSTRTPAPTPSQRQIRAPADTSQVFLQQTVIEPIRTASPTTIPTLTSVEPTGVPPATQSRPQGMGVVW